jgi:hypothetical protein
MEYHIPRDTVFYRILVPRAATPHATAGLFDYVA